MKYDMYNPGGTTGSAGKPPATQTAYTNRESSNSSSATSNTGTKTGSSSTQNMSPESLAILNQTLMQLATGGTPVMQADRARKDQEIANLTTQRQGYSKGAAFADAQGLMAQTMAQSLQKLIPGINTGALGSGSSQSSMRALLTQRAAETAAQAASAQGLGAAVNYGQVANGQSNIIAQLLGQSDPATAALIQLMSVAKGSISNTQTQDTTSSTGTVNNNGGRTSGGGSSSGLPDLSGAGFGGGGGGVSGMSSYGPIEGPDAHVGKGIGSTNDFLNQLYGNDSFSNVTF